ncbi:FAD-binding protein [Candidatus Roizmanbacteria bacterium]|nr:FAD-binding protein [Candidatus Roizmanbacteria bacterium]
MSEIIQKLETLIGRKISHSEPLSAHTLLQDNTIAEYYIEVETIDNLIKAVLGARSLSLPVFVFGSGSFFSLPDETILGLVIKNNCRRFDKISMKGKIKGQEVGVEEVLMQAEAGTLINQLVRFTFEEGLSGLEYYLGLPGTVGGAIYTKAKYKNNYVRNSLKAVRVLTDEGKVEMHTDNLDKHIESSILLSAIFQLVPGNKATLWERGREAGEYRTNNKKRYT